MRRWEARKVAGANAGAQLERALMPLRECGVLPRAVGELR